MPYFICVVKEHLLLIDVDVSFLINLLELCFLVGIHQIEFITFFSSHVCKLSLKLDVILFDFVANVSCLCKNFESAFHGQPFQP